MKHELTAALIAALALSPVASVAQSTPAVPVLSEAASVGPGDVDCMWRLLIFRSGAKKISEDSSKSADKRADAADMVVQIDQGLSYYLGRISTLPDSAESKAAAMQIFDRIVASTKDDQAVQAARCLLDGTKARLRTAARFRSGN